MSVNWKVFIDAQYAANAETTYYTSPANVRSSIDKFTATNVTAGVVSITVRLVPSGGTPGANNAISYTKAIAAGEAYTFPELAGATLSPGDFISILASAAASLVIRSNGRQAT